MNTLVDQHESTAIEVVNTAAVPRPSRERVWLAAMRRACDAGQVTNGMSESFGGTMLACGLSGTRISMIAADAQAVRQPDADSFRPGGAIHVCSVLSGSMTLTQDGARAEVLPGQVATFDSTRPFQLHMRERFRMVLVRSAHRSVRVSPRHTSALTAQLWEGTSGVSAVIGHLLAALGRHLSELDSTSIDPLVSSVRSMIMCLFAERLSAAAQETPGARQILMARVQSWAREHLQDISLTPDTLAQRHNISLRYLQLLFAEHGTSPARWIRDERLARCHADLGDPRYDHLTVSAIGERWGLFGGAPQMSRLFRERYGYPPSAIRQHSQAAA